MNKQEAQAEIKELLRDVEHHNTCKLSAENRIVELQAIIEAPESGWFVPDRGEKYHFLTHDCSAYSRNTNDMDKRVLERQKVFRTKSEAQKEDDKRKATIKYLREIARLNSGWKPDWNNEQQKKYYAKFRASKKDVVIDYCWQIKVKDSDWYSLSEQAAKQALSILSETEIDLIFRS